MLRAAVECRGQFGAPPGELETRDSRIGHLAQNIAGLATNGVHGQRRSAPAARKHTNREGKAGAARRGSLGAVFLRAHGPAVAMARNIASWSSFTVAARFSSKQQASRRFRAPA